MRISDAQFWLVVVCQGGFDFFRNSAGFIYLGAAVRDRLGWGELDRAEVINEKKKILTMNGPSRIFGALFSPLLLAAAIAYEVRTRSSSPTRVTCLVTESRRGARKPS